MRRGEGGRELLYIFLHTDTHPSSRPVLSVKGLIKPSLPVPSRQLTNQPLRLAQCSTAASVEKHTQLLPAPQPPTPPQREEMVSKRRGFFNPCRQDNLSKPQVLLIFSRSTIPPPPPEKCAPRVHSLWALIKCPPCPDSGWVCRG